MALRAYLSLNINGSDVTVQSPMQEMGGVDVSAMIELHAVDHSIDAEASLDGRSRGAAMHDPIIVTKSVDEASPLLARAITRGERAGGTIHFFRTNTDDGSVEHFYTIEFEGGQVGAINLDLADVLDADSGALPVREHVAFNYRSITWTHELASITATASAT